MLEATRGVNTHKGAVFILGVLCGAIGRLWSAGAPCADIGRILQECAAMTRSSVEKEFALLHSSPDRAVTNGQKIFLMCGLPGIRGEAAEGFPDILLVSLPKFRQALLTGYSRNDAGTAALLALIARGIDTNMVARGGIRQAQEAACTVSELLEKNPFPSREDILRLDRRFIEAHLSPGGCADLLAATYFLYDWSASFALDRQPLIPSV